MITEERLHKIEIDIARLQLMLNKFLRVAKPLPDLLQVNSNIEVNGDYQSMKGNEFRNFTEQIVVANTGSSYEIDWAAGTLFELTLTGSPTITFANLAAGRAITLVLIQDGTGSRTITWPGSVDWPDGTEPTLTTDASAVDVITLFVRNDGSTVCGFDAGLDMG